MRWLTEANWLPVNSFPAIICFSFDSISSTLFYYKHFWFLSEGRRGREAELGEIWFTIIYYDSESIVLKCGNFVLRMTMIDSIDRSCRETNNSPLIFILFHFLKKNSLPEPNFQLMNSFTFVCYTEAFKLLTISLNV